MLHLRCTAILCLALPWDVPLANGFLPPMMHTGTTNQPRPPHRPLQAHYLTSALESLATENKVLSDHDWLADVSSMSYDSDNKVEENVKSDDDPASVEMVVPLYPLPAVYLPTGSSITYTLQNIEPRNLQMALDLAPKMADPDEAAIFCATLRTVDTGRMANVGTLLRITDMETKSVEKGQVQKIVLTCVADQGTVDVVNIENPHAADLAYRLRRPSEYLTARVRRRPLESDTATNHSTATDIASQIAKDFNRVRDYLVEGFGAEYLPPFARQNMADALPELNESQLLSTLSFWKAAFQWQTYASTLREGYQQRLVSDRNELLIAGALKQGGPLNLPVHLTDLLPQDREQVLQLEQDMQQQWTVTGLEPVLDFQALLVCKSHVERLRKLADMVAREQERLTMIALMPPSLPKEFPVEENVVRKGAWFDADW